MLRDAPFPVSVVSRASAALLRAMREADIVHALNPSPDVVVPARLLGKGPVVTVFNRRQTAWSPRGLLWRAGLALAPSRCYISQFVWDTWEPRRKRAGSERMVAVSELPQGEVAPAERAGFCFVGRFIENKGIEELVQAYAQARIPHAEWKLTLIGDGPIRPRVEKLIDALGLRNVHVAGFVDAETKARALRSARWIVAPHRTQEDLGLAPIEGRSVGVPSIVTRDGGLPEAAGASALVCEPGDVAGLAALLERAARMPAAEYAQRAATGRDTLPQLVRPLTADREIYARLAHRQ
jgi:glycosyltransferase involved in cell wall biosynthesis